MADSWLQLNSHPCHETNINASKYWYQATHSPGHWASVYPRDERQSFAIKHMVPSAIHLCSHPSTQLATKSPVRPLTLPSFHPSIMYSFNEHSLGPYYLARTQRRIRRALWPRPSSRCVKQLTGV